MKKKNASKTLVNVSAERAGAACIVLLLVVVVVVRSSSRFSGCFLLFLSIISRPSFRIGRERRRLQLTGVNASLNIKRIILLVPKQNEGSESEQKKNDFGAAAAAVAIRTPSHTKHS